MTSTSEEAIEAAQAILQAASLYAEESYDAATAALYAANPAHSLSVLFGFWVQALLTISALTNIPAIELIREIGLHVAQSEAGLDPLG